MHKAIPFIVLTFVGLSSGTTLQRIIGGQIADDGSYPFMSSLRVRTDRKYLCGGAIVTPKTIITTANCLRLEPFNNTMIVVGTNKIDQSGAGYMVERFLQHPEFVPVVLRNDIGLVFLYTGVTFGERIQPIDLSFERINSNTSITLSAWGYTKYPGGAISVDLYHINLTTITNDECESKIPPSNTVFPNNVCTLNGVGQGMCYGDIGSPLIINNKLVALASFIIPCANGIPEGHTRIEPYENWINNNTI